MSEPYTIGRLRGECCVVFYDAGGKRHRHSLGTADPKQARLLAPAIYRELTRPRGKTVTALWDAYVADHVGRAVVVTMEHTWKALRARFGGIAGDAISIADSRAHIAERRAAGKKDGTILTELSHLRMVLTWSVKNELIDKASYIERPPKSKAKEDYKTKDQMRALIGAAGLPHVRLYIILLIGTAARTGAILDLTWTRCNFDRDQIDLRNPEIKRPHKGRAIVPMTRTVRAALLENHKGALSPYVIEWAGKQVRSVKRALSSAARAADIGHISPHMIRHSAAVHMAEDGQSMEVIAQYLGHKDVNTTRNVYARFSPNYLRQAAASLEYDDEGSMNQRVLHAERKKPLR